MYNNWLVKLIANDRERQQTSGSYREPHRGYQQGYIGTYRPPRQNYQSRQQPQQQSNTQQQTTEHNIPNINMHPFTKNLNVLDVDNMDTIREDVV